MGEYRPPARIAPGTVLAGRYRVDERGWQDEEATIWRGVDIELGRRIGVFVPRLVARGYSALDSFRRQFEMLSAIDHPGVMRVYDIGTDPAADAYLITEPIEWTHIVRDGPLSAQRGMEVMAQTADALAAVHDAGLVYRAMPHQKVNDGTVVLLNSYRMHPTGSPNPRPGNRSVSGDRSETALTDIFDLGAAIYFWLTGRRQQRVDVLRPYRPPSWERPRGARGQPPPPLVPVGVQSVVDRAVADRPEDRWPTAAALAEAARRALA